MGIYIHTDEKIGVEKDDGKKNVTNCDQHRHAEVVKKLDYRMFGILNT